MLALYEAEAGERLSRRTRPDQLEGAARAMARAWNAPSARILRQAKGAPEDAGLGLVVQEHGARRSAPASAAPGTCRLVDSRTGAPACVGGFLPQGRARRPAPARAGAGR